jgi:hypothetical protein
MKKSDAFIVKKRKEWEKKSDKFRSLFEKNADPQIIADFLTASTFALKAAWVNHVLIQAFQDGRYDFLDKALATARDQRKNNMNVNAIKSLWTVIEVDRLTNSGMTKDKAFKKVAETEWGWSFDVVKDRYYRWRTKDPEIYVEEKDGYRSISAYPAKISMGGGCFPGRWEIRTYPDRDQEISWTIYYPTKTK